MAKKTTAGSKTAAAKKTPGKTTSSTSATSTSSKPAAKKAAPLKQEFTDEQIAMKAYEIYQARLARGEQGHSDDDWHMAVKELRKEKK
jgi:hypothetical protein